MSHPEIINVSDKAATAPARAQKERPQDEGRGTRTMNEDDDEDEDDRGRRHHHNYAVTICTPLNHCTPLSGYSGCKVWRTTDVFYFSTTSSADNDDDNVGRLDLLSNRRENILTEL